MNNEGFAWVFNGETANFPSAVFSERKLAEDWIRRHKLTGTLTAYPVDIGAYQWCLEKDYFTPKKESHSTAEFIANFSSASQEHYHYEEGGED